MKANSDDTVVIPNDYAIGEGNRDIIGGGEQFLFQLVLGSST
ncbi:MAG: hypothetical protein WBL49_11295 [Nitrososphaeraceae archaeon]